MRRRTAPVPAAADAAAAAAAAAAVPPKSPAKGKGGKPVGPKKPTPLKAPADAAMQAGGPNPVGAAASRSPAKKGAPQLYPAEIGFRQKPAKPVAAERQLTLSDGAPMISEQYRVKGRGKKVVGVTG